MTLRAERQRRLKREAELNGHVKKWVYDGSRLVPLPCVPGANMAAILQREADRPLRGGDAELAHESLFGDAHLQREMPLSKEASLANARARGIPRNLMDLCPNGRDLERAIRAGMDPRKL